ncbi:hypothetical protein HQ533_01135 [Candidatus Woesearchaeota archaeon]|nr:hypothetical protein [Candidatus Woesearchaeota archaeon]
MRLDYLVGKTFPELIVELPKFEWRLMNAKFNPVNISLKTLMFVNYDNLKPRDEIDMYWPVDVSNGLSLDDISFIEDVQKTQSNRLVGFISKAEYDSDTKCTSTAFANIPMIDFDTHETFAFMEEDELLNLIKTNIREVVELEQGVILKSSPKRNYFFLGIGNLLDKEDFITFIGLTLSMKYATGDNPFLDLVDTRHAGHSLTPMKYLPEIEKNANSDCAWSSYELVDRFSTLRISPKEGYKDYPVVVDVL